MTATRSTQTVRGDTIFFRRFELVVVDGPDRGVRTTSSGDELSIGTVEGVGLRLADPAVSRHHCAIATTERGLEVRDLGSTNGTLIGEVEIARACVPSGSRLRLGRSIVEVRILDDEIEQPLATRDRFGDLIGRSPAMRRLFPILERCASSDATVLIEGDTGTGKELAAEAIHRASPRRAGPFVVVDCGALPRIQTELELFGHVRGAFPGAGDDRAGAFELASGGTILLDQIGELPLDLQPMLLRALDSRQIRRVGSTESLPLDVRVIAASQHDLRVEVNQRRFRSDLYYRLDVIRVAMPALANREGDVELLAQHFWRGLAIGGELPAEVVADLVRQRWAGNVRELRNALHRMALVGWPRPDGAAPTPPYTEAKERATRAWEGAWIRELLAANAHNVSRAARAAQMSRSHLRDLIRRYEISAAIHDEPDPA